jgi:hypothetical protein
MLVRSLKLGFAVLLAHLFVLPILLCGQGTAPPAAQVDEPPPPKGIEVLARGPVHEAFALLTAEPAPTKAVPKRPPKPIEELPPAEKPEGNVLWIGGYWGWDEDRKDFLWVSGLWRTPPPGKQWIAGYWREEGEQWQWVGGFWTAVAADREVKEIVYLPKPPEPPAVAPAGQAPIADSFYVPAAWIWRADTGTYAWRAGYWARVQPGYVWVADHFRWTPSGYIHIPGYWDLAVSRRGVLYAPVFIDPTVVTTSFYYTPSYAISSPVVVDTLFVQPAYGHYYFGDYYGPTYAAMGYQSAFVYGAGRYDSVVVYETWAHRSQPNWVSLQINIYNGRSGGALPLPPRTLVQQNTIVRQNITNVTNVTNVTNNITNNTTNVNRTATYNTPMLSSTSKVAAAQGLKTIPLDSATRTQAKQQAAAVQQVAMQRTSTEKPLPPGAPRQARVASLSVPKAQPVQNGFVAPKVSPQATNNARTTQPFRPSTVATPKVSAVAQPAAGHPTAPLGHPAPASVPGRPAAGTAGGHPAAPRPPARPPTPPAKRPPPKNNKEHHS